MAAKTLLRRWNRFFPAFGAIDATIESAWGCSRDDYRKVRADIVSIIRDAAAAGGAERVEELCALLDQTMVEALQTLQLVAVTPAMVTSTDIARAVASLRRHESGQVRSLARRIFDGWRAKMEGDLAMVRAALEKLSPTPQEQEPVDDAAPSAGDARSGHESKVSIAEMEQPAKVLPDPERHKKMPPGGCSPGGDRVRSEKTGDVKRKRPGGYYREAEDVKRRRKVPEMVEQRSRKAHPTLKEREPPSIRPHPPSGVPAPPHLHRRPNHHRQASAPPPTSS